MKDVNKEQNEFIKMSISSIKRSETVKEHV
jgi:hypothetical protein